MKFWLRLRQAKTSLSILCLGVLAPSNLVWSQPSSGQDANLSATEFVDRFVAEIDDLTANFEQDVFDVDNELLETSTGQFFLLRPNRFAWYYESPYELVIIADGQTLWMHDVELEQVTRAPLTDLATSPAMVLSGEGTVGESFVVSDAASDDGRRWIELLPNEDASDFVSAKIAFFDGVPIALELIDGLSQLTRIEFDSVTVNSGLRGRDFEFDPPAGVDVVGEGD